MNCLRLYGSCFWFQHFSKADLTCQHQLLFRQYQTKPAIVILLQTWTAWGWVLFCIPFVLALLQYTILQVFQCIVNWLDVSLKMEPFYKIDSLKVQFFWKPKLYWLRFWQLSQIVEAITDMVNFCKSDLFNKITFVFTATKSGRNVILWKGY